MPGDNPRPLPGHACKQGRHLEYHAGCWQPLRGLYQQHYARTGTLWEGRHRSSLVQSNRYLLTCMRYIELNPVRAGLVEQPEAYRWSSYAVNARGDAGWLQRRECCLSPGASMEERCHACRELFRTHVDGQDLQLIRQAAHYCQPVGDDRFRKQIEQRYGVRLGQLWQGRPGKAGEK